MKVYTNEPTATSFTPISQSSSSGSSGGGGGSSTPKKIEIAQTTTQKDAAAAPIETITTGGSGATRIETPAEDSKLPSAWIIILVAIASILKIGRASCRERV